MKHKAPQDPLVVIFEQHLYHFQDSDTDRKTFCTNVAVDYLRYLQKGGVLIPRVMMELIQEEVEQQIKTMLLKKTYGFQNIEEYSRRIPRLTKRRARSRYGRLQTKKQAA